MIDNTNPYLIGETAFHHQGDIAFLKVLIDKAAEVNIDAVKFHLLLNVGDYFKADHEAFDIIKEWVFSENQWKEILEYTKSKKLDVILLCNDPQSINFANSFPKGYVRAIELHATGLNDYLLLEKAAKFEGTVILGVGGSTLDEIEYAIQTLNSLGQNDIFLMYGFQNYPTRYEDINLQKMLKLQKLFDLPIGYADHTDPNNEYNEIISTLGVAHGINVCEKHFTHAIGEKRIDGQAAISVEQLKKVRELMGVISTTMGNGNLKMSAAEQAYGDTGPMKKAIVAEVTIKKGETIELNKIGFKRTNESTYMLQSFLPKILGLKAKVDIGKEEFIDFSKIDYVFKKTKMDQFKANK